MSSGLSECLMCNYQEESTNLPDMGALPWWQRRLHAVAATNYFKGDLRCSIELAVISHLQIIQWDHMNSKLSGSQYA